MHQLHANDTLGAVVGDFGAVDQATELVEDIVLNHGSAGRMGQHVIMTAQRFRLLPVQWCDWPGNGRKLIVGGHRSAAIVVENRATGGIWS